MGREQAGKSTHARQGAHSSGREGRDMAEHRKARGLHELREVSSCKPGRSFEADSC